MIDLSQVSRRDLHFENLDAIALDVKKVTAGPCYTTGNWTAGQLLEHLAIMFRMANHGTSIRLPWPVRCVGRVLKWFNVHRRPIKPGRVKLPPKVEAAFVPPPEMDLVTAKQNLLDGIAVAQEHPMRHPSPLFGRMSPEDWLHLQCRHAELHLSFLHAGEADESR